jgi:hypothetical protein
MIALTSSKMGTFMTCPQKHDYQHVKGRVPLKTGEALSFGRLWHKCMEAWWSTSHNGKSTQQRLVYAEEQFALDSSIDPFEREKLRMMLAGYTARWGEEPIETVAVELPFKMPLCDPDTGDESEFFCIEGTIDKIVRKEGKLYIVEHKTSGDDASPGSDYWRRLAIDTQISVYYDGARAAGYDVVGCIYDVAMKPGQKPLKATPEENRKYTKTGALYANQRDEDETPVAYGNRIFQAMTEDVNAFFVRGEVARLDAAIMRARRDTWEIAWTIQTQMEAGMAPRNTRACRTPGGGLCEYFDVCSGAAELSDPTRFKDTDYRPAGKQLATVGIDTELGF